MSRGFKFPSVPPRQSTQICLRLTALGIFAPSSNKQPTTRRDRSRHRGRLSIVHWAFSLLNLALQGECATSYSAIFYHPLGKESTLFDAGSGWGAGTHPANADTISRTASDSAVGFSDLLCARTLTTSLQCLWLSWTCRYDDHILRPVDVPRNKGIPFSLRRNQNRSSYCQIQRFVERDCGMHSFQTRL
jgi:hypothetical protein